MTVASLWLLSALALGLQSATLAAAAPSLKASLKSLRSVGPEGLGNEPAKSAWRRVASIEASSLPLVLESMDGANDYALNWLRSAVDAVAQKATVSGRPLPVETLHRFLRDRTHHPRARRLAFELIRSVQPEMARSLLPEFLDDPAPELRRDAVQQRCDAAEAKVALDKAIAIVEYRKALAFAREADQLDSIAKKLKELGSPVNLSRTFGWVTAWKLIGPFDNTTGVGFSRPYPPETSLDLSSEFEGKTGRIKWAPYETTDDYGMVNFNAPLGTLKGVVGYAAAEFWSKSARPVQIRLGSQNGWKVWVNGKPTFGRDEYHRASEIDQYRMPVMLVPGRNFILVKCLQNEQTEDWAAEWQFQLRVTDEQGTPLLSSQ